MTKAEQLLASGLREAIADMGFLAGEEKDPALVLVLQSAIEVANLYLRAAEEA